MPDRTAATVAAFGKITFIPRNHTLPALPDMDLLVLEDGGSFQVVCIDVEIDAVGNTIKDACSNLKQTLRVYTTQMVHNYGGNVEAAAKDIINVSFSPGELKAQLFAAYMEAKHQYILERLAKKRDVRSRKEDFINACNKIFQVEPIRFNLTLAATIA